MGVIQDLRDAGVTVILNNLDPESRGRVGDVRDIVFAPSRTAFTERGQQIDRYADTGDFMGMIDRQGRFVMFAQGPMPRKYANHPNLRRDADILVLAPGIDSYTSQQLSTIAIVRQVLRAVYGPPAGDV